MIFSNKWLIVALVALAQVGCAGGPPTPGGGANRSAQSGILHSGELEGYDLRLNPLKKWKPYDRDNTGSRSGGSLSLTHLGPGGNYHYRHILDFTPKPELQPDLKQIQFVFNSVDTGFLSYEEFLGTLVYPRQQQAVNRQSQVLGFVGVRGVSFIPAYEFDSRSFPLMVVLRDERDETFFPMSGGYQLDAKGFSSHPEFLSAIPGWISLDDFRTRLLWLKNSRFQQEYQNELEALQPFADFPQVAQLKKTVLAADGVNR